MQKTTIKPLKRLKTSQIDSLLNIIMPFNINTNMSMIKQEDDNKHLAEEFFFQSHPFSDLKLLVQSSFFRKKTKQ